MRHARTLNRRDLAIIAAAIPWMMTSMPTVILDHELSILIE
jgi:hypothetical protein